MNLPSLVQEYSKILGMGFKPQDRFGLRVSSVRIKAMVSSRKKLEIIPRPQLITIHKPGRLVVNIKNNITALQNSPA